MTAQLYAIISVILVSLISFIGVLFLSFNSEKLSKVLLYLVSFAAGAFFGDIFFHLLPEAGDGAVGWSRLASLYSMSGIVFLLIVEKFIYWRHCHYPTTKDHPHPFALMNLIGDGIHNFVDGVVIGASYLVSVPVGVATTIAVILHEIPQEIGDFGVLLYGGFSKRKALIFNFLSAAAAIAGTLAVLAAHIYIDAISDVLIPFAIGCFIYIAGSDLIPEIQKEGNIAKSYMQVILFILGIAVMAGLLLFENKM
ncbi:MAG TPA: ZIP family metal transporter [Candidatus Jacksonbacteria bacterium]|nr:ZIP family metal transporter [Candidatus Jacksonbacteria bacterium]